MVREQPATVTDGAFGGHEDGGWIDLGAPAAKPPDERPAGDQDQHLQGQSPVYGSKEVLVDPRCIAPWVGDHEDAPAERPDQKAVPQTYMVVGDDSGARRRFKVVKSRDPHPEAGDRHKGLQKRWPPRSRPQSGERGHDEEEEEANERDRQERDREDSGREPTPGRPTKIAGHPDRGHARLPLGAPCPVSVHAVAGGGLRAPRRGRFSGGGQGSTDAALRPRGRGVASNDRGTGSEEAFEARPVRGPKGVKVDTLPNHGDPCVLVELDGLEAEERVQPPGAAILEDGGGLREGDAAIEAARPERENSGLDHHPGSPNLRRTPSAPVDATLANAKADITHRSPRVLHHPTGPPATTGFLLKARDLSGRHVLGSGLSVPDEAHDFRGAHEVGVPGLILRLPGAKDTSPITRDKLGGVHVYQPADRAEVPPPRVAVQSHGRPSAPPDGVSGPRGGDELATGGGEKGFDPGRSAHPRRRDHGDRARGWDVEGVQHLDEGTIGQRRSGQPIGDEAEPEPRSRPFENEVAQVDVHCGPNPNLFPFEGPSVATGEGDAGHSSQVARPLGHAHPGQQRGGGHDRSSVFGKLDRGEGGVLKGADADARVEAHLHEVDHVVGQEKLELEGRVPFLEVGEDGGEIEPGEGRGHREAQGALHLLDSVPEVGLRPSQGGPEGLRMGFEAPALIGQAHGAGRPVKEPSAELGLEPLEGPRHRMGGTTQLPGRSRQGPTSSDDLVDLDVVKPRIHSRENGRDPPRTLPIPESSAPAQARGQAQKRSENTMYALDPSPSPHAVTSTSVWAPLQFIVPRPGETPRFLSAALAGSSERFFFDVTQEVVPIEDVRRWKEAPRLDREGFALLHRPTRAKDLRDDEAIERIYRPEVERLVAEGTGAEHVVAFDVTRRSDALSGAQNPDGARHPAARLHVDYTKQSGPRRARDVLGASVYEAAVAAEKPIVQVNAWRPIVGPVRRSPLTLADASRVLEEDLVATEQVFPDRVGEIYHLRFRAGQRFGYASEMATDEVILIKGWDSRTDGRARFTPHSAFELPGQDAAPARESIEVRTFAVLPARP